MHTVYRILELIVVYAVPTIFAITMHEAAHGYVAKLFGDNTAWILGRVTLNPIKHIDPVGTIAVPGALLIMNAVVGGGFLFGWAKPVPVNFSRLHDPKRSMLWVALAGPAANALQVLIWTVLIQVFAVLELGLLVDVARAGISINLMLMIFNLLPILPLDGGRILTSLLPWRWASSYARLEPYGMAIMLALIVSGALSTILNPLMRFGLQLVQSLIFV